MWRSTQLSLKSTTSLYDMNTDNLHAIFLNGFPVSGKFFEYFSALKSKLLCQSLHWSQLFPVYKKSLSIYDTVFTITTWLLFVFCKAIFVLSSLALNTNFFYIFYGRIFFRLIKTKSTVFWAYHNFVIYSWYFRYPYALEHCDLSGIGHLVYGDLIVGGVLALFFHHLAHKN